MDDDAGYRTIPQVLTDAARRDPDGIWIRTDEGTMTFGAAAAQVAATAAALHDAGVRHGDHVLVTARTTAPYLLCWLALAWSGAVTVSANPRSAPAELAGLAHQTAPRAIITDAGLMPLAADAGITGLPPLGVLDAEELTKGWDSLTAPAAGPPPVPPVSHADVAVLIPTSGTTGRSKLVMQTHRAYAMAGEGFPYWMELTAADRLMTSLPLFHINAPAYSVMGSLACGAGLILLPRFSASTFPRLGPAARRDRVQRDRGHAGDPDAPGAQARRRGHAAAAVLHRAGPGQGAPGGDGDGASACASSWVMPCRRARTG